MTPLRPLPDSLRDHRSKLAWTALVLLALTAMGAALALGVGLIRYTGALDRANAALNKSHQAFKHAGVALAELQVAEQQQHYRLQESCERLNVARAASNSTTAAQFVLYRVVLTESSKRHTSRRFLGVLSASLHSLYWTPLTNCGAAIDGRIYRTPTPIPFSTRFAPKNARDFTNASLLNPVGSVP